MGVPGGCSACALRTDTEVEAAHEGSEEPEAGQGEDDAESLLGAEAREGLGAETSVAAGGELCAEITVGCEAAGEVPSGGEAGAEGVADAELRAGGLAGAEVGAEGVAGAEVGVGGEADVHEGGETDKGPRVAEGTEAGGQQVGFARVWSASEAWNSRLLTSYSI